MLIQNYTSRWGTSRLSALFKENVDKNCNFIEKGAFQFCYGSLVPKHTYELTDELIETYKKYTLISQGDIVLNGLNLNYDFVTQRVAFVEKAGIITSAYICLRPRATLNNKYYAYLFKALDFKKVFNGLGTGIRLTLSYKDLKNYDLPVPPRDEQDQIVRFLDWKVSSINRLINIKKNEIKEIESLKKSLIDDCVTHGLNPDVPMKDSGVKWLGQIPAHWKTIKLRQILHPISIKNCPDLPLLSVVREKGIIIRDVEDKESNHNFIPDDLKNYKKVEKGQFAINKMKAWQGSYGVSNYAGIVSPAYFIFNVKFDNLEYFHYAIRSKVYVNFFAQSSDGIRVGQWDLQIDKMKEIPFIVPPADEQIQIVNHIKITLPKYDIAIEKLSEEIKLLHELKSSIISDAVTGQIDVRDVKIPSFDMVEEDLNEENLENNDETEESGEVE